MHSETSSALKHWLPVIGLLALFALSHWGLEITYFKRTEIADGELWRLFSAHFMHLNLMHLAMNAIALSLLWYLQPIPHYALIVIGLALAISLSLYAFVPDVDYYVGFSGVLHGQMVIALYCFSGPAAIRLALFVALMVKCMLELVGVSVDYGFPVVFEAHAFGLLAAVLGCLVLELLRGTRVQEDINKESINP